MSFEKTSSWERTTLDDVNIYKQFKLTERLLKLNEEIENIIAWKSRNRYSEFPREELEMCDSFRTALKVFLISVEPLLRKNRSEVDYWEGPLFLGEIDVEDFAHTNLENYDDFIITSLKQIVELPDPIVGLMYLPRKTIGKPMVSVGETVEIPIPWEVLLRAWRHVKYWSDSVGLSLDLETKTDWKGRRIGADYYRKAMENKTNKINVDLDLIGEE